MFDGKLYSVWIDGVPSPCLSAYHDDDEARAAFDRLLAAVRADVAAGTLAECTDLRMDLYYHGTINEFGIVRGLSTPKLVCTGEEVLPDVMSEEVPCEDS